MNIGLGNIGLGGLDQAELQRRIAQYQSGIGSVPAPTTAPVKAVAPRPTPIPYRGGPSAPGFGPKATPVPYATPVAPKPAPVKAVAPKPAITDARVPGAGIDYVAPKPTAAAINRENDRIEAPLKYLADNKRRLAAEKVNPFLSSDSDFAGLQDYRDKILSGGADYNKINDVDNVDDYYDNAYEKAFGSIPGLVTTDVIGGEGGVGGGQVDYSNTRNLGDGEYRSFVSDVPEYLKGFKTVTNIADTKSAYGSIAGVDSVDDTSAVLSSHYGYDYKPAEAETRKFGGNLQTHTSSNAAELSEFQSLVRPILNEQIPYLQATEGLGYQDALMEAYKRDPMLQSLYAKYDVTPARQTKDGSSYLYDPMSYSEIRTKEVKDSSVKDAIKMAAIIAASVYGGGFLASSGLFGGAGAGVAAGAATPGVLGTGLAYGTASGLTTAVTGGDLKDVAKSFATAGITAGVGAYAKGLASNAAELGKAAKGAETAAMLGKGSSMEVTRLAEAAKAAADTANTFNKTVKGVKFITKAVSGDAAGAAISLYGDNLTKGALNKAGFNEEFLTKYNINQDDLTAGLVKTQLEIAGGAEVGDALISGLGQYIQEGGAVGPNKIKAPEFLSRAAKVLRTVGKGIDDKLIEPVKDAAKPIARGIRKAGKAVDDKVIEPILDPIKAAGKTIDDKVIEPVLDPIKAAGSAVDDVTKPVREGVSDVVKDTVKATGLGVMDVIALLTGSAGSRGAGGAGSNALAGSGVRGGTPGIIEEKTPELFKLNKEKKKVNQDELSEFLMGNNPIVNAASGGMIQSSYGDLFDTIHQPKQTSDSTLNELLRIVGSK
jgi:hypothetical protein